MKAKPVILWMILLVVLVVVFAICGLWAWAVVTRGKYM
jgi:hypothetical protein